MTFKTSDLFLSNVKKLAKDYRSIKKDLETFTNNFSENHLLATPIKNNIFKIRIKNSDKQKGKRAGYRIYYYLKLGNEVFLLTIYDKSKQTKINESIVFRLIDDDDLPLE